MNEVHLQFNSSGIEEREENSIKESMRNVLEAKIRKYYGENVEYDRVMKTIISRLKTSLSVFYHIKYKDNELKSLLEGKKDHIELFIPINKQRKRLDATEILIEADISFFLLNNEDGALLVAFMPELMEKVVGELKRYEHTRKAINRIKQLLKQYNEIKRDYHIPEEMI